MRRSIVWLVQNAGTLLLFGLALSLIFAALAACQSYGGLSFGSFLGGLQATLKLLMMIEPPRSALSALTTNASRSMVLFGWLICIMGWLFIPLLIAFMVDLAMRHEETLWELRITLYRFYQAQGLTGEDLEKAVEQGLRVIEENIRKARGTAQ